MTLPLNRLDEFRTYEDTARFNMIEQQIRPWNVDDAHTLQALNSVKREAYVAAEFRSLAFVDMEVPLVGEQDALTHPDRCMLAPKIEARFLNDLKVQGHERVLEIGTGSGYMAALLASQGQEVISVEVYAPLVAKARQNLERNEVDNVQVIEADASKDLPAGNFDVIVISGAVSEIPAALLEKLNEGGRLIGIVGASPVMRATLVQRKNGALNSTAQWDYKTALLPGFPKPSQFKF